MIDYIKGEVAELSPTSVTLEQSGIGYQLNITLNTYGALSNQQRPSSTSTSRFGTMRTCYSASWTNMSGNCSSC